MKLFCISVSHKTAGVEIREKLAFTQEVQRRLISELCSLDNVTHCVLLCTCNRTEVYFCGSPSGFGEVKRILAAYGKTEEMYISPYIRQFQGDGAVRHLFYVACGIDSMVIGEDEILGQTKIAYQTAKESGTVSYELNMTFQAAIACAKKIKTQTALSRTSVSIATLAANEAARLGNDINVLVIGATGKTGLTVLKNLLSHKNVSATATLRTHKNDFAITAGTGVKTVDYADRYRFMDEADCVISATSSPHYTVTLHGLQGALENTKNRLFIDLAVPPDIDEAITQLNGVKRIGIDYFEHLAEENNVLKLDSVESAKHIISDEIDELKKELVFHDFLPYVEHIRSALSEENPEALLYKLKSELDSSQLAAVLNVLKNFGGHG